MAKSAKKTATKSIKKSATKSPKKAATKNAKKLSTKAPKKTGEKTSTKSAGKLSTADKDKMPDRTYAFPEKRKEPLEDASHVRNAIARFNQVKGVTEEERKKAITKIKQAAKRFGVEVNKDDFKK